MLLVNGAAPARRPRVRGAAPARTLASSRSRWPASEAPLRSRPISTRNRARCDSSASFAPNARARSTSLGTSPGHASPSARASANNTGRLRARPPHLRDARRGGTRPRRRRSTPAALRPPRAGGVAPRHGDQARGGRAQDKDALSTSAVSAGIRAWRAARSARASAARAAFVRRRRIAIPATTSSWAVLDAGGKGAGSSSASVTLGLVEAPDQEEAPDLEIPRVRGVHPVAVLFERRPAPRRAPSQASQVARDERDLGLGDDAPRAGHGLPSDRRHAPHVAGAPSPEPDRRAAPSRCLEARAPARRRAGRPGSVRRGDHPRSERTRRGRDQ
jgi:hypothetical protein